MPVTQAKTPAFYAIKTVNSWTDALALHEWFEAHVDQWVFRGQTNWSWPLQTTFERALRAVTPPRMPPLNIEGALLRRFARQAHHYCTDTPADDNWLQWLALMQHYGAPTRLLDWTYSFFVGLHFAIDGENHRSALWALNKDWATRSAQALLPADDWRQLESDQNVRKKDTFATLFARRRPNKIRYVLPVNPYRLNQRLAIQQGLFVCPGDIRASFEQNLAAMPIPGRRADAIIKVRVALSRDARMDVIRRLFRMNVTPTTLFPGLDGFSRSLKLWLALRNTLVPETDWPREGPTWPAKTTTRFKPTGGSPRYASRLPK